MHSKLTCIVALSLALGTAVNNASALVVDDFQEWTQRIQLATLGGLEITSTGHARFTARVDHDVTDVIIHPGGLLETLDTYKLPDNRHDLPETSNMYVYGTWNARDIQSFGIDRAAFIYIGAEGEVNLERGYNDGTASYNIFAWLDEAQLGGRSLLLAPELDPTVWSLVIEDLGGGAGRITAFGPPPANAEMPNPEDLATDVPRDVILSWTPGIYAPATGAHTVFFSENFNDVNDGVGGVNQDPNTYDPGRLDFGQTYYWRVDEVNGAPDFTTFMGTVWSFTAEPLSIPISGITATASSTFGASGPEKTIDGSGLGDDLHGVFAGDMWISAGIPATIEYAFDRAYKLHELWIWNSNQIIEGFVGFGAKDVVVEHSLDGENWTVLEGVGPLAQAPGAVGYRHNNTIDFGGATAQHVRVTVNSVQGVAPQASLSEVRFLYIPTFATGPNPAPDATSVAPNTTLSWGRNGREADRHEIYVGSDLSNLSLAARGTESSFDTLALDLQLGETYFWRVDEVNEAMDPGVWTGDIWNFTTSDTIIIDDMESYKDVEFFEIWATWVDGFDDPSNGSLVGNGVTGSPETDIVHAGGKSLPLHYGNGGAAQSEATRTFAAAQDWSKHGVQGLALFFHGSVDNTGGRLYVMINNTRVDYDGDAANLQSIGWHNWTIDLAALPATTRGAVTSLTIGIDGGGTGVVTIDDILLTAMPAI